MTKTKNRQEILKEIMAAPLENYPYLSGRVTKVVYNKKILKTAAVFPSSAVVVVTRADAQVPSIVAPNEF